MIKRIIIKLRNMIYKMYFGLYNEIWKWFHGIKTGDRLKIQGKILVSPKLEICIGNDVRINSGVYYGLYGNVVANESKTAFITVDQGHIIIGNNVGISNSVFVSRSRITVCDDVLIGGGCRIYDNDFHSLDYYNRMKSLDTNINSKPVTIKNGAFIGGHSIILKGVTIGEKSIVGAGSVVTHSIPDGEIWGGNPAVFIKKIDERNRMI